MKRLVLSILGALALTLAATLPAHAIVGGTPATQLRPYMGSLQVDGQHGCGATLIAPRWALTAFHCVQQWKDDPAVRDSVQLRFDSLDHTRGGTLSGISAVHLPPNAQTQGADIALLELPTALTLTPATLPEVTPAIGADVDLIGWGITCTQSLPPAFYCGQPPAALHTVQVRLNPDWLCTSLVYGINGPSELCLGDYLAGKTACYGDSGGPALLGDRVVGVTSRSGQTWLYGNCALAPIIYTDVAAFRPWITRVTGI